MLSLHIEQNGGFVQLSWPSAAAGYTLEAAQHPVSGPWQPVTNTVMSSAGPPTVLLNPIGSQRFFRLKF